MRAGFWIARREIEDRRMLLLAAALLGIVPLAIPLLATSNGDPWSSSVQTAQLFAAGLGVVLAIFLGATVIGRDLSDRSIGFDLSRPVGERTIWAGRLGAAVILCISVMAIVLAPTTLVGFALRGFDPFRAGPALRAIGFAALLLLAVLPLSHLVGVAIRSRARVILFDLIAATSITLLALATARLLLGAYAETAASTIAWLALALAIPVLWIASAMQLERGRADLEAGHRAQSLILWPALAVIAAGAFLYSFRYVTVGPEDLLHKVEVQTATAGNWLAMTGNRTENDDYRPTFLLDLDGDRAIRMGARGWADGDVLFSDDGTKAVWVQREPRGSSNLTLRTIDLDSPELTVRERQTQFSPLRSPIKATLSPTGKLLAGIQQTTLTVHDIETNRTVTSIRLPRGFSRHKCSLAFRGERTLRLYYTGAKKLELFELYLDREPNRLQTVETANASGDWLHWTPDHDRLLLIDGWGDEATVLDGNDGTRLWDLPQIEEEAVRSVDFLSDGTIVAATADGENPAIITVYTRDGELNQSIELDIDADIPALGHEILPGRVLVGFAERNKPKGFKNLQLYALDAASGKLAVVDTEALPFRWSPSAGWAPPRPGSARARLLASKEWALVLIDPKDLSTKRIGGDNDS